MLTESLIIIPQRHLLKITLQSCWIFKVRLYFNLANLTVNQAITPKHTHTHTHASHVLSSVIEKKEWIFKSPLPVPRMASWYGPLLCSQMRTAIRALFQTCTTPRWTAAVPPAHSPASLSVQHTSATTVPTTRNLPLWDRKAWRVRHSRIWQVWLMTDWCCLVSWLVGCMYSAPTPKT